ncbi:hypothetical protein EV360DRAFT_89212 [Lentinula raphanica]|nr:hypothetical protein EV360DRAFT_89212 [Lentinula raphanica]
MNHEPDTDTTNNNNFNNQYDMCFFASPDTPRLKWNNGTETILPFLEENGKNSCSRATFYAREMAELGIFDIDHEDVQNPFVEFDLNNGALEWNQWRMEIEPLLARGKVVVLRHCGVEQTIAFESKSVTEAFGLTESTTINALDMRLQETESTSFCIQISLSDFFTNGAQGHMTSLDTKIDRSAGAFNILRFTDGHQAWTQTDALGHHGSSLAQLDVLRGMSWALLSHAGSHSSRHVDCSGCSTVFTISSGCKIWGVVQPNDEQDPVKAASHIFTLSPEYPTSLRSKNAKLFLVTLNAGDTVIQPPLTIHTVYTPLPTIATGGHFHTFGTLHLTEASRRVEMSVDISNNEEDLTHHMLVRMILSLPQHKHRQLHQRPLAALAAMVLWWKDYYGHNLDERPIAIKNIASQRSELDKKAEEVAYKVLALVGFKKPRTCPRPNHALTQPQLLGLTRMNPRVRSHSRFFVDLDDDTSLLHITNTSPWHPHSGHQHPAELHSLLNGTWSLHWALRFGVLLEQNPQLDMLSERLALCGPSTRTPLDPIGITRWHLLSFAETAGQLFIVDLLFYSFVIGRYNIYHLSAKALMTAHPAEKGQPFAITLPLALLQRFTRRDQKALVRRSKLQEEAFTLKPFESRHRFLRLGFLIDCFFSTPSLNSSLPTISDEDSIRFKAQFCPDSSSQVARNAGYRRLFSHEGSLGSQSSAKSTGTFPLTDLGDSS